MIIHIIYVFVTIGEACYLHELIVCWMIHKTELGHNIWYCILKILEFPFEGFLLSWVPGLEDCHLQTFLCFDKTLATPHCKNCGVLCNQTSSTP